MTRPRLRASAISCGIAATLLYAGAGALGAPVAAADGGTVSSSQDRRVDRDGRASKEARTRVEVPAPDVGSGPRQRRAIGSSGRPSAGLPAFPDGTEAGDTTAPAPTNPREEPAQAWPWPWPWPCPPENNGTTGVGGPRPATKNLGGRPEAGGDGGNHGLNVLPPLNPAPRPPGPPGEPGIARAESGSLAPAAGDEPAPITMPPVIGLPPAFQAPIRVPAVGRPAGESGPRGTARGEPATGREPPVSAVGGKASVPVSTRNGYPEYLKSARMGDVAVLALPGVAGIIALTVLGGILGYRQAKAGHVVRAAGTSRFLQ